MTLQIVFCIAIFLYMIVMLAWNKYPMGVTALTSMALLILFKATPHKYQNPHYTIGAK